MAAREWDESDVRVRPNKKGSRPRTKDRPDFKDAQTGHIITVDRGRYTAVVDEGLDTERTVLAVRARELRRTSIVPTDFVDLVGDVSGGPDSLARLVRVQERSTVLRRSADDTDPVERVVVANADRLVIVVAAANPQPRTGFIDRALVAAYDAGIEPILCITKTDLQEPTDLVGMYSYIDVPIVLSRAAENPAAPVDQASSLALVSNAVGHLRELLDGHTSVLVGPSGVGKSTMVNALTGSVRATGAVNAVTGRGRHTSSSALALPLVGAGAASWIVDTPGIRSFGLAHVDSDRIVEAFEELAPATADCPRGCTHRSGAPNCALDAWVAGGHAGPYGAQRLASLRALLGAEADREDKELGAV